MVSVPLILLGIALATGFASRSPVVRVVGVAPNAPLTAMDESNGTASNSPMLAIDPSEPRFVVAANRIDGPDFSCALQRSGDGGHTWIPAKPVPALPPSVDKCYGPEVAFDRHGTLYYLFIGLAGAGNEPSGAFLTTSRDRGKTFSAPRPVLGPLNFGVRMAIDPTLGARGRIHLTWLHATSDPPLGAFGPPPNPIMTAYSDDGGRSFSKPLQVSDVNRPRVVAPALTLGPNHTVYIVYYDLRDDERDYKNLEGPVWDEPWEIILVRSTDGGRTFSNGESVTGDLVPPERPILIFTMAPASLVANGDRVCAAWGDARNGDPDIMVACSRSSGPWLRRRINDDSVGNGARQYLPKLGLAPTGRIDAVFYDRRDDPENVKHRVYYAYSTDGGMTFAPNVAVTPNGFSSRIGPQYVGHAADGQYELGSRLAAVSLRNEALLAWADTRNSSSIARNQDVFGTSISLERDPPSWAPRVFGAAMAGVGIGILLSRRKKSPS